MARRRRGDRDTPISLFSFQDIMAAVTGVMMLVTLLVALEPLADELLQAAPRASAEAPPMPSAESARALVQALEAELERRLTSPMVDERTIAELDRHVQAMTATLEDLRARRTRVETALSRAAQQKADAERAETSARMTLEEAESRWSREQLRSRVRFLPGERSPKAPLFLEVRRDGCVLGEFAADGSVVEAARSENMTAEGVGQLLRGRSPEAYQVVLIARQDALEAFASIREALHAQGWDLGWQLWDAREGGFFDATPASAEPAP